MMKRERWAMTTASSWRTPGRRGRRGGGGGGRPRQLISMEASAPQRVHEVLLRVAAHIPGAPGGRPQQLPGLRPEPAVPRQTLIPERKKPTPAEAKRRLDEKQFMANLNRANLDSERQYRRQQAAVRMRDVNKRRIARLAVAEQVYAAAGAGGAEAEGSPAGHRQEGPQRMRQQGCEVSFINNLTAESVRATITERLTEVGDVRSLSWSRNVYTCVARTCGRVSGQCLDVPAVGGVVVAPVENGSRLVVHVDWSTSTASTTAQEAGEGHADE